MPLASPGGSPHVKDTGHKGREPVDLRRPSGHQAFSSFLKDRLTAAAPHAHAAASPHKHTLPSQTRAPSPHGAPRFYRKPGCRGAERGDHAVNTARLTSGSPPPPRRLLRSLSPREISNPGLHRPRPRPGSSPAATPRRLPFRGLATAMRPGHHPRPRGLAGEGRRPRGGRALHPFPGAGERRAGRCGRPRSGETTEPDRCAESRPQIYTRGCGGRCAPPPAPPPPRRPAILPGPAPVVPDVPCGCPGIGRGRGPEAPLPRPPPPGSWQVSGDGPHTSRPSHVNTETRVGGAAQASPLHSGRRRLQGAGTEADNRRDLRAAPARSHGEGGCPVLPS